MRDMGNALLTQLSHATTETEAVDILRAMLGAAGLDHFHVYRLLTSVAVMQKEATEEGETKDMPFGAALDAAPLVIL